MKVKACVIQDSPVFFDKELSFQKLEKLCSRYAKKGCELIVFPESFIPGYPRGFSFGTIVGSRTQNGRVLYQKYYENSVDLTGEDLERLQSLSAEVNAYLVVGVTERENFSGSLFCSMVYLSPTHGLLGVHRKIKPTGQERVIWSEADGRSLVTFQTKIGKLGGLICWENYMPMARMSMYQKGVEVYVAPTADSRKSWIHTMQHIALEGRCFVLGCNQYFTKSMYPEQYQSMVENEPEEMCRGGSLIVSPMGETLAGPLWDKEGALIADLDLDQIVAAKLDFDVVGHYSRNDIFQLEVSNQPPIKSEDDLA